MDVGSQGAFGVGADCSARRLEVGVQEFVSPAGVFDRDRAAVRRSARASSTAGCLLLGAPGPLFDARDKASYRERKQQEAAGDQGRLEV